MRIGLHLPSQRDSLIDLLIELAQHYDAGAATRDEVAAHLDGALTGPASPIHLVTAARRDRVVGLAALVVLPSLVEATGPGRRQCQLKELFVATSSRSGSVGSSLLRWSAGYAVAQGCGRMDWNVKTTNVDGIRFYERHGARLVADRLSYRIEGPSLASLATPSDELDSTDGAAADRREGQAPVEPPATS